MRQPPRHRSVGRTHDGALRAQTYPGKHFFLLPHSRAILNETGVRLVRSLAEVPA